MDEEIRQAKGQLSGFHSKRWFCISKAALAPIKASHRLQEGAERPRYLVAQRRDGLLSESVQLSIAYDIVTPSLKTRLLDYSRDGFSSSAEASSSLPMTLYLYLMLE